MCTTPPFAQVLIPFRWRATPGRLVQLRGCILELLEALNHQQYFSKDSKNYPVNHGTQSQLDVRFQAACGASLAGVSLKEKA